MRVLHVGKYFAPHRGGMESFLADLVKAQQAQGLDVMALVHGTPLPADPPWLVRVPVQTELIYAPIAAGFPAALARAIHQFKPDILHLHMPNNAVFWALVLPSARAIPWVVHWHSDVVVSQIRRSVAIAYALYQPFERAVLRHARRIIATSPPYLEASAPLKPWRSKCVVVPLGLDTQGMQRHPAPSAAWSAPGPLRLLSIGRLTYYKGFKTLVQAVLQLPGVELRIVGEGELRPALQTLINAAAPTGKPAAVQLLGNVSEAEKQSLLADCDIFCLPSIERTEAFGMVLLEAMHYARPCIVSDLPGSGMPWVIEQGPAGLRVPAGDIHAWQRAITQLQQAPALRTQLGQAGAQVLERQFHIAACASALLEQYQRL